MEHNTQQNEYTDFDAIGIKLASPDTIKGWSHGEVTKPETINYRTGRSERNGLFDERIFGPEKDYECYCGKYRRIRYKGIICEKCGVEVTKAIVRRERMGHIELASPVSHIWFLRGIPSRLGLLLNISGGDLEKVVYFAGYIITKVHQEEKEQVLKNLDAEYKSKMKQISSQEEKDEMAELMDATKREIERLREGIVIDETQYHRHVLKYGTVFEAGIGAEAIYDLCKDINLEKLETQIEELLEKAGSAERVKLRKRLGLVRAMIHAGLRPEWMFLTVIPVTPPGIRPMVALEGGRHATSDINDLYRRVINRNNRLSKLKDIKAPDVILRNEKRILQEAVDALIDNSMRHQSQVAVNQAQRRALKSLADNLKGKQGYFRQNLLGKRVDYSGRSVIVVGSNLALDQCGLPKHMALELFRPFVIAQLIAKELAYNIRGANRLIDDGIPEVWAILEDVTKDKYVMLNRAPTLHRLGIQAFRPVLIEGNAIQIHPLVCTAFNADFDGDQMAVHVPLGKQAQKEARELIASSKNLLGPASGTPIVNPSQDIVLGCFWMTKTVEGEKGEGKFFSTPNNAITAYEFGAIGFRTKIKVLATEKQKYAQFENAIFETTVGRLLFNAVLPDDYPFINSEIRKKDLSRVVHDLIEKYGIDAAPPILDKIKTFGFKYATKSGITWGMDDISVPKEKPAIIEEGEKQVAELSDQYNEGLLSDEERYRKSIAVWQDVRNKIEEVIPGTIHPEGSANDMIASGARGSMSQLVQMAGMKGLIMNTAGQIFDFPVIPSNKEGLSPIEYFVTTHGSRKGLADTALKTAEAGYLTRRLVYVADNAVVAEDDCGTKEGRTMGRKNVSGFDISLAKDIRGRILAADITDPSGNTLYKKGALLTDAAAKEVEDSGVEEVYVRSPLSCKSRVGLCRNCYGMDLGRGEYIDLGEPVGIIAAQAIGEPGTQLTMRTFHQEGVVGSDITTGLPRVVEIFERRTPKSKAVIATADGMVTEVRDNKDEKTIVVLSAKKGSKKDVEVEYSVPYLRMIMVKKGDSVSKGDILTDGSADIADLFKHAGREVTESYIINEINKVYELQGTSISRKHIEVVVRQMFARSKIKEAGETPFVPGSIVETAELGKENDRMRVEGKEEAVGDELVLGITEVSLTTKSFLSSASFQHTSRVLINSAVRGTIDDLNGLKENVIIGRLIPAGTGFKTKEEREAESVARESGEENTD